MANNAMRTFNNHMQPRPTKLQPKGRVVATRHLYPPIIKANVSRLLCRDIFCLSGVSPQACPLHCTGKYYRVAKMSRIWQIYPCKKLEGWGKKSRRKHSFKKVLFWVNFSNYICNIKLILQTGIL